MFAVSVWQFCVHACRELEVPVCPWNRAATSSSGRTNSQDYYIVLFMLRLLGTRLRHSEYPRNESLDSLARNRVSAHNGAHIIMNVVYGKRGRVTQHAVKSTGRGTLTTSVKWLSEIFLNHAAFFFFSPVREEGGKNVPTNYD